MKSLDDVLLLEGGQEVKALSTSILDLSSLMWV